MRPVAAAVMLTSTVGVATADDLSLALRASGMAEHEATLRAEGAQAPCDLALLADADYRLLEVGLVPLRRLRSELSRLCPEPTTPTRTTTPPAAAASTATAPPPMGPAAAAPAHLEPHHHPKAVHEALFAAGRRGSAPPPHLRGPPPRPSPHLRAHVPQDLELTAGNETPCPPGWARDTRGYCSPPITGCYPPHVPTDVAATANATGFVSVKSFAHLGLNDDALNAAILAAYACTANVFLPPGDYRFNSTVHLPNQILLSGGSRAVGEFLTPAGAVIYAPSDGPAFQIGPHISRVHLHDLVIEGVVTGLIIVNAGLIRLTNVAVHVSHNIDGVPMSYPACGAANCNIVFGSNNTAMVVENTYWLWVEDSEFSFLPEYDDKNYPGGEVPLVDQGMRPAVVLRGSKESYMAEVSVCYLLHFDRITTAGGAFQYQQLTDGDQYAGFFDFNFIVQERSGVPMLDVQARSGVKTFNGLQQVTITDASAADMSCPNYLQKYEQWLGKRPPKHGGGECVPEVVPVVALNATPTAVLDGFTMTAVSSGEGYHWGDKSGSGTPAIRVFEGDVSGVTILTGQLSGAADVRDYKDRPVGGWVGRSAGGWTLVGQVTNDTEMGGANLSAWGHRRQPSESKVLTIGQSHETGARLAVEADGTIRYGDGDGPAGFHTALRRQVSNTTAWDPPSVPAGGFATTNLTLAGVAPGDLCIASLSSAGDSLALEVSARVVTDGEALVVLRHLGAAGGGAAQPLDVSPGLVRVAALQYV